MKAEGSQEPDFAVPAGTVTFLLADVEGSVRRWEADHEAMASDMAVLDEALAAAIGRHGGVRPLEQGEGDSAVAAFAHASDAAAAALEIQRRLASEAPEIRLRIGLHTGEAQRRDGGSYFGRTINRCARLRDVGHGGQVLLSRATAELLADRLPQDASLEDLGRIRLRDLARPEQVYQLLHPTLPRDFPPLRSLDEVPNNLPVQLTSFVGREVEIAEIGGLLAESRIVTLTGSGGAGKTRLALQVAARVADRYPDGVWWVDLAPVADPELLASSVAAALRVREIPTQLLMETITGELRQRRALIVLDNCEHLVEACAGTAATILKACPEVTLLATSRHTLDVEGEAAFRVPSLRLPEEGEPMPVEALQQYEAVQLFIDRAVRARPNFRVTNENAPAVAQICHRLDGIPLAIELAAARVRVLSPERIAAELKDVFHVLAGGARTLVPRHQTLRASVDWSHGLLSEDERAVLRRLTVFAGGFTLDAAEAVASGDGIDRSHVLDLLSALVDKSLVHIDESGTEPRYWLLETIRQYGTEKLLEAGERDAARSRHLDFFTTLAEASAPQLEGAGMLEAVQMLRREHDNVRAALDWSLRSGQAEKGLRLAGALRSFWFVVGHWSEARRRYEALLAEEVRDGRVLAWGLLGAAMNCFQLLDWPAAYGFADRALSASRDVGDQKALARAQSFRGTARMWAGDFASGRPLLEEAVEIARDIGDRYTLSQAYWALGNGAWFDDGDLPAARGAWQASLSVAREAANPLRIGMALTNFGVVMSWAEPKRSEPLLQEAVRWLQDLGEPAMRAISLGGLCWARVQRGDHEGAREYARQAARLAKEARHPAALGQARWAAGALHWAEGELEAAARNLEEGASFGRFIPGWAVFVLAMLARVRIEAGDVAGAGSAADEAERMLGEPRGIHAALIDDARARVARGQGDLERAERLAHDALPPLVEAEMKPSLVDVLELLAWAAAAHESHAEAARLFGAAQTTRDALGYLRFPSTQARYEEDVALARSGLPDEAFEKAWAEGAAMSLEEAVAYARRGRGERKRPSAGWASLTPTELEVAKLVADRLTNPQIAERMYVSRGTVKSHLEHIYAKLGISSRMDLADEFAKHSA